MAFSSSSDTNSLQDEINLEDVSSLVLDIHIEKDKTSFTPVDIEIQILNERLKAILEEIISRTEIVIVLNNFREFDIRPLLQDEIPAEDLDIICDEDFYISDIEYVSNPYTIITKQMVDDNKQHVESITFPKLSQVFHIFAQYPQVKPVMRQKAQEIYEKYKKKMLNPPDTVTFLRAVYRLKTKIEERITMPALEKLKSDMLQSNLKRTNQTLKEKIEDVTKRVEDENNIFSAVFQEKDAIKRHHQAELDLLKSECVTIIKKKIVTSERQMMKQTAQHKLDYEELIDKEAKITTDYDHLLKDHMDEEDILRSKRFKIETTLLNWLQKYDKEVGDRQTEFDDLTEAYDNEKLYLADLKTRFGEQEKLYTPLIGGKIAEEKAAFDLKFDTFRFNHAAKKIQRWWKGFFKKHKKKGKKGKKR